MKSNRVVLNAMLWVTWNRNIMGDILDYYPSWSSAYNRFRRWKIAGICDRVLKHVAIETDFEECNG
ncbi:transposase [Paenibacillus polymyxa]|uniref:Transposase n=1 Tax=Paenibacillus polymyxa TaxID=1406 RepID=A0A8I1IQZ5_PAEPO|nr:MULTISPECIES: transposase [Paenibacillus]KAF6569862.1 transposase [Paenibacillus sp. EKM206P]KAF6585417.1 transposase [Paenibacillus sp. EKM205P]MBM0635684.1 transposase [Paenibacillus polymyxa]